VNAMFFIGYCAGCIASPQLWTKGPRYFEGVIAAIVTWCLLFASITAYRIVCTRDNNRRDKATIEQEQSSDTQQETVLDATGAAGDDLTDKEDRQFRYSW
ncbi:unnamed protein product, partial [Fusarium langsethiae]